MKLSALLITFISILSFSSFADEANVATAQQEDVETANIDLSGFQVGVGYVSTDFSDEFDANLKGSGFSLQVGREFELPQNLLTVTSLQATFQSLDIAEMDGLGLQQPDVKAQDFGINQQLYTNIETKQSVVIQPFIAAGLYFGELSFEGQAQYQTIPISLDAELSYYRYSATVGTRILLENGLAPYAKFEISRTKLNDSMDVSASGVVSGVGASVSQEVAYNGVQYFNSQTFSVGLSYLF